jgi:hypothetical protein
MTAMPGKRPVGLPHARNEPSDGLPPIEHIPDRDRIGLAPDQLAFLKLACDGRSIRMTGPGGTGKTLVLTKYVSLRKNHDRDKTAIFCVSPDKQSLLRSQVPVFEPPEIATMLAAAALARKDGKRTCLIVDEYVSLDATSDSFIGEFDQTILAGDPAQGGYDYRARIADAIDASTGWTSIGASFLWRSSNHAQFNLLNGLAYEGSYESFGAASNKPVDSVRTRASGPTPDSESTEIGIRALRNAAVNPGSSIAIAVKHRRDMNGIMSLLATSNFRDAGKLRIGFVHIDQLHGIEADTIVLAAGRSGQETTEAEAEATALTFLGRPRYRSEIGIGSDDRRGALNTWLPALVRLRLQPAPDPRTTPYDGLRTFLEERGLSIVEGLGHLAIHERATGRGVLLVNLMSDDPRETRMRALAAASKRWTVATRHLETLGSGIFDPGQPQNRIEFASSRPAGG